MKSINFISIIIIIIFTFQIVKSQNNEECNQQLSIFAEFAKVKNYDAAYEPWVNVRDSCPKLNRAIYSYGELILKDKIKNSTGQESISSKEDLMKLYDEWVENFSIQKNRSVLGNILSRKGQAMIDFELGNLKEIYNVFDNAFKTDQKSFTNPKHLYNYFSTLYKRYKLKDSEVSMELLFNKYEEVSEKFDLESVNLSKKLDVILKKEEQGGLLSSRETRNKRIYDVNSNAIGTYLSNLNTIIIKEATCSNLIPLYKRNFEANKGDTIWLKRAASRMDSKECSDDSFFVILVEALHAIDPSADSAYYLGLLNDKRGKNSEALKYYEESIELETDNYKKAKILYRIANKFKNSKRKFSAKKYALKALSYQPSLGRAYLMIANLYAESVNDCGDTQFNKRALYWLAAETALKASRVDASLKKISIKTAESYRARAPSKTDIFTEGNEGSIIKFDCWVNSSIKVPKL
jgi:tetratricopeptide (TPR) repeat protein